MKHETNAERNKPFCIELIRFVSNFLDANANILSIAVDESVMCMSIKIDETSALHLKAIKVEHQSTYSKNK